ncbi:nuclear transport factor 2 family protein [Striga asiatica]|uniref:Nuclear transport factor 2 family protein n=1 Tax=Striga asiatica TaxID=4170 RepID=A0A5A7PMN6_STRAF|nr:nuclear transport factor 2 family protein [Striga asiatica]
MQEMKKVTRVWDCPRTLGFALLREGVWAFANLPSLFPVLRQVLSCPEALEGDGLGEVVIGEDGCLAVFGLEMGVGSEGPGLKVTNEQENNMKLGIKLQNSINGAKTVNRSQTRE